MTNVIYLWRETRDTGLSGTEIQRQLDAGNDVEGLADLPIKEMIDRLKTEFPGCKEVAGLLVWQSEPQRWRATWSWQFMRLESENLEDELRDRFFELARSCNCQVYDAPMNLKML